VKLPSVGQKPRRLLGRTFCRAVVADEWDVLRSHESGDRKGNGTMISEAELMELSFPDAPKMVTEVPGPRVSELMAESAKYEAFTRGGAGFPVIL
jgi:hypothetical protein